MSQRIVLFHSALGLRPAVRSFAEKLRAAGHTVHTPDFYDGEVFDNLEAGVQKRDSLGYPELMKRADKAVADLPANLVYAGFSMGAGSAEHFAATRPGSRGAILMHGAYAPELDGIKAWPGTVPVQVHYAKEDPWVDAKAIDALATLVKGAGAPFTVFTYPGAVHLFADEGYPDHVRASAWLMLERVLEFLAKVDLATVSKPSTHTAAEARP